MPTNVDGFVVFGAIEEKWLSFGGLQGALGHPVSNETPTFDGTGRFQNFQKGIVSWRPETGAHVVWGLIGERWLQIGREQFGYPVTDETPTPDGRGRFNHFRAFRPDGSVIGDSSIYWTPETGAHEVYGAIRDKWASMGWETSPLGYPVDHEQPTFDGVGRRQNFQGGMISWSPETGACAVWGLIGARWLEIGSEQFGYPVTDETPTPDGRGRFNHFRAFRPDGSVIGDSSIYWTPETGAHEVYGAIRDFWATQGWENSQVGYPVSAERDRPNEAGREQQFQRGRIIWSPATGAFFGFPTITVDTERLQTGGYIRISGEGFTPGGMVYLYVENLVRQKNPFSAGSYRANSEGKIMKGEAIYEARCWPNQFDPAVIRAVDVTTGKSATGESSAFTC